MIDKYLIADTELELESQKRKKEYLEEKVKFEFLNNFENGEWQLKKQYKNGSAVMYKEKDYKTKIVDKLWMILYKMGFSSINNNDNMVFSLGKDEYRIDKQIDIIALDDETCIFIDCHASKHLERVSSFIEEIESINKSFRHLCNIIRDVYGDRKCKYILATSNILLSDYDIELLKKYNIVLFDNDNIDYYQALVNHLGSAARYQLLGNLFSKTVIRSMDEKVPAIEGKMGNLTYYSFLIEPDRLLKIGYVLHRNKANHNQMPTYQRLIKKERLKSIQEYVNNGGYFPNSLIISLDVKDNNLRFDKVQQNHQSTNSKLGTLYLPKEYQSAYIIDGQHRLYGYSNSKYAKSDTLPVIAFVNLDKEKQVKMFMDINENQKPVSKTLRNILNIDLNWSSDILSKRREAIILNICQSLGENTNSPLYGRVITGEDSLNETRCITIEYLKTAIDKTNFFNRYSKNNDILEKGLLDLIDSESTYNRVYSFIRNCLQVLADICKDEWEKGANGYLTINNTIVGAIRVISDITNIVYRQNNMTLDNLNPEILYSKAVDLLITFGETINNLPNEKKNEIKTAKGGSAKEISYRILQVALHANEPTFINPDLERYIEENCTNYNEVGLNEILYIKEYIIEQTQKKITGLIDWENLYFPEDLSIKLHQRITAINIKNNRLGIDSRHDLWSVFEFDDINRLINYKSNWSVIFKNIFTVNSKIMSKIDITNTIKSILAIETKINNGKQITKSEYQIVNNFYIEIMEGV